MDGKERKRESFYCNVGNVSILSFESFFGKKKNKHDTKKKNLSLLSNSPPNHNRWDPTRTPMEKEGGHGKDPFPRSVPECPPFPFRNGPPGTVLVVDRPWIPLVRSRSPSRGRNANAWLRGRPFKDSTSSGSKKTKTKKKNEGWTRTSNVNARMLSKGIERTKEGRESDDLLSRTDRSFPDPKRCDTALRRRRVRERRWKTKPW